MLPVPLKSSAKESNDVALCGRSGSFLVPDRWDDFGALFSGS
jgi:hypothetical protein